MAIADWFWRFKSVVYLDQVKYLFRSMATEDYPGTKVNSLSYQIWGLVGSTISGVYIVFIMQWLSVNRGCQVRSLCCTVTNKWPRTILVQQDNLGIRIQEQWYQIPRGRLCYQTGAKGTHNTVSSARCTPGSIGESQDWVRTVDGARWNRSRLCKVLKEKGLYHGLYGMYNVTLNEMKSCNGVQAKPTELF